MWKFEREFYSFVYLKLRLSIERKIVTMFRKKKPKIKIMVASTVY